MKTKRNIKYVKIPHNIKKAFLNKVYTQKLSLIQVILLYSSYFFILHIHYLFRPLNYIKLTILPPKQSLEPLENPIK